MIPFLKQIADHYYTSSPIEDMCFVFPNRRSMAFYVKYLRENVQNPDMKSFYGCQKKALRMPHILTISDFFHKSYGAVPADRVALLLELYECYKEIYPNAESLDDFINWGDVILADFSDVDKYLIDPEQLFRNVAEYKDMQDDMSYLSDNQREALNNFINHFRDSKGLKPNSTGDNVKARFLMIWDMLLPLYRSFNERLRSKGMVYDGMVYRDMVESLSEISAVDHFKETFPKVERFVFVGLNALNECERTTLRKMQRAGIAEFCWDYSSGMLKNLRNRSSEYMKLNVEEFPQNWKLDTEGLPEPEIKVIGVPSSVGQAKQLPDILKECALTSEPASTDCVIVLPDESLLMPVLNSIPTQIKDINVTMGYPMTSGSLWALMSEISIMQLHLRKRGEDWLFYNKQVRSIFSNGIFASILDEQSKEIVSKIKQDTKSYIPCSDFSGSEFLEKIFQPVVKDVKSTEASQIARFEEYQLEIVRMIALRLSADSAMATEIEFAKLYYTCVNMLRSKNLAIKPVTYIRLLGQIAVSQAVPFVGEPLKGLQIMGPLETRALDFDNVVILSCNEGIFPKKNSSVSFIPPELRKGFALPTNEFKDAVLAYSFYRLIQRSKKIWLIYDSRMEKSKTGEESRYIKQLEYHFRKPVKRYIAGSNFMLKDSQTSIPKPGDIAERLKDTKLSVSSLQNYLKCPAKFYYATVCALGQDREILESMNDGMVGNVYHSVMHALYLGESAMHPSFKMDRKSIKSELASGNLQPLKYVTDEYLESWQKRKDDIREKIKALIKTELNTMEVKGRDLVLEEVILMYVLKTLERDRELLKEKSVSRFKVHGLEQFVQWTYKGYSFVGYIDRLDSFEDGTIRIVDYKTGKVEKKEISINEGNAEQIVDSLFKPDVENRPSIAIQLFLYDRYVEALPAYKDMNMINVIYPAAALFTTSVSSLENPTCELFDKLCMEKLDEILDEIADVNIPFRRTEYLKSCSYCDFKNICGR